MGELAQRHGCTPAQLALAWTLAKNPNLVPIPGATRISRLEENAAATDIELSAADLRAIGAVAPLGAAAGLRHPEQHMAAPNG